MNDDANENNAASDSRISIEKTTTTRSFEYKTKTIGSTPINNKTLNKKVVVPLKFLSYFWRSLDLPLINCEIVICHGQKIA